MHFLMLYNSFMLAINTSKYAFFIPIYSQTYVFLSPKMDRSRSETFEQMSFTYMVLLFIFVCNLFPCAYHHGEPLYHLVYYCTDLPTDIYCHISHWHQSLLKMSLITINTL